MASSVGSASEVSDWIRDNPDDDLEVMSFRRFLLGYMRDEEQTLTQGLIDVLDASSDPETATDTICNASLVAAGSSDLADVIQASDGEDNIVSDTAPDASQDGEIRSQLPPLDFGYPRAPDCQISS